MRLTPSVANAPDPGATTGYAHPEISEIRVGGDGIVRSEHIQSYAFIIQGLCLTLIIALVAMAVTKTKRTPVFRACLALSYLVFMFVWWQIFSQYQRFLETGITEYFLGFPIASAWMTFAIWGGGLCLVALYSIGFKHYIYSKEDEQAFEALLKKYAKDAPKKTANKLAGSS